MQRVPVAGSRKSKREALCSISISASSARGGGTSVVSSNKQYFLVRQRKPRGRVERTRTHLVFHFVDDRTTLWRARKATLKTAESALRPSAGVTANAIDANSATSWIKEALLVHVLRANARSTNRWQQGWQGGRRKRQLRGRQFGGWTGKATVKITEAALRPPAGVAADAIDANLAAGAQRGGGEGGGRGGDRGGCCGGVRGGLNGGVKGGFFGGDAGGLGGGVGGGGEGPATSSKPIEMLAMEMDRPRLTESRSGKPSPYAPATSVADS
eukprot:6214425-Pleurochrysis_carterae.AAC.3